MSFIKLNLGYPGYWREGFITIQKAIDVAIEKIIRNIAQDDTIEKLDGTPNDTIGNLTEMLAYTFLVDKDKVFRNLS